MRKLKEGDYFAPKNKEEYSFILKSLRDLGYKVNSLLSQEKYINGQLLLFKGMVVAVSNCHSDATTYLTLHDLFIEEVETFEPFQRVLVRDYEDKPWEIDIYDVFIGETDPRPHVCLKNAWRYCIDYDTNKDKHDKI